MATIHHIVSEEMYDNGEIIFREDSPGDWVYIILSGSVEIFKTVGDKETVIKVLGEDEIFGELGFLGGIKRTAGARAVGPTVLGLIDRAFLDNEFNKLSSEFRAILKAVVDRFKHMLERASEFPSRTEKRALKVLSLSFRNKQSFVRAYSANVSSGGLFVRTPNPLNHGDRFLLRLNLPDLEEPLHIHCDVAWARKEETASKDNPAGMGIKFVEMDPEDRKTLGKYVEGTLKEGK
jgi:uncharacterized protein (TIGR02266 family)